MKYIPGHIFDTNVRVPPGPNYMRAKSLVERSLPRSPQGEILLELNTTYKVVNISRCRESGYAIYNVGTSDQRNLIPLRFESSKQADAFFDSRLA